MCVKNNTLNCWNVVKAIILQHSDERNASANVAKAEKNDCMVYGVKPKCQRINQRKEENYGKTKIQ